jgi:hypothetical protein
VCLQAIRILTLEPERLKNRSTTPRTRITGDGKGSYPRRSSGLRVQFVDVEVFSLQRLAGRSFDDLQPEGGSFSLEIVDLQVAMLSLIKFGSSIDELHPVAQHAVDQSG